MKFHICLFVVLVCTGKVFAQQVNLEFAPAESWVKPPERPYRDAVCLNGSWKFMPGKDLHGQWETTPVKVPSPWNVNGFAKGNGGDFVTYPSYPAHWETVKEGWLMRTVAYNSHWKNKRLFLHFEAVAGYAQVYVNRKKVGENRDVFLPFEMDITDAITPGADIEVLVHIIDANLFNVPGKYGHRTYVAGSFWGQHAIGIWQDVFLVAKPGIHIQDVFVQPHVNSDELFITATVSNNTGKTIALDIAGSIMPCIVNGQPEINWKLGEEVLAVPAKQFTIPAHGSAQVRIQVKPGNRLQHWWPEHPRLYGLVLSVYRNKKVIDRFYERFGWRQFTISGQQLLLNGRPIVLKGDSWHFMGIPQMTRRYAWAWYTMLKDCHANAVRLHAQPYPRFYLDMADEMGIMVLDETGIWASDGGPKADAEAYWQNCDDHLRRLIKRDRNHPSVFGWSVCNENLPVVMHVQRAPDSLVKKQVAAINNWVRIGSTLDPSRTWISGDGETNLPTDLPTVIGHYGHDSEMKNWSSQGKIWGIGEQGMGYAGTPREAARFIGDRAYESMEGRMEGVAEEALQLLNLQKKYKASFMSVFNLVWYGLQPLALGLRDTTKAPQASDGIFFGPYQEGKPGVQPERLGPYTTTLNPGYDARLPLYRTWPLFDAVKASFATNAPLKERPAPKEPEPGPPVTARTVVLLSADKDSVLARLLMNLGVQLNRTGNLVIIDGKHPPAHIPKTDATVLVWGIQPSSLAAVNALLPQPVSITERKATSFIIKARHPLLNGLDNAGFYFSETANEPVMQYGVNTKGGKVLVDACNTDWKTWNHQPEAIKTGAVIRSERESKPVGHAFIETGNVYLLALEPEALAKASITTLRRLLLNFGIGFKSPRVKEQVALSSSGVLQKALVLGAFTGEGNTMDQLAQTDVLKDEPVRFLAGSPVRNRFWEETSAEDGIFDFKKMSLQGPSDHAIAYLSFWVYSPRSLTNLLVAPDMPILDMHIGADDAWQLYIDGKPVAASIREGGLKRRAQTVKALPLEQGWNHFLIKVMQRGGDWKVAVEFECDKKEFLKEIRSVISREP
jgi:Beta-galactosidase/beta-glucuronidase